MKKVVSLLVLVAVILVATSVFAADATLSLSKSQVSVGDEVVVTINFPEKAESVDLTLNYDNSKVQYVSSSIEADYLADKGNAVAVSWFSVSGTSSMTFTFKAKANGTAAFSANVEEINDGDPYNMKAVNLTIGTGASTTATPTAATTATVAPTAATTATVAPTATTVATVAPTATTAAPTATTVATVAPTATAKPVATANATAKPAATAKSTTKPTKIPQAGNTISVITIAAIALVVISGAVYAINLKNKNK